MSLIEEHEPEEHWLNMAIVYQGEFIAIEDVVPENEYDIYITSKWGCLQLFGATLVEVEWWLSPYDRDDKYVFAFRRFFEDKVTFRLDNAMDQQGFSITFAQIFPLLDKLIVELET